MREPWTVWHRNGATTYGVQLGVRCTGCQKIVPTIMTVPVLFTADRICFRCDDSVKRTPAVQIAKRIREYEAANG